MKFKTGDKVKCIRTDGFRDLSKTQTYTIHKVVPQYNEVYVSNPDGYISGAWNSSRFEIIETFPHTIEAAKSLIGKNVTFEMDGQTYIFKVNSWEVYKKSSRTGPHTLKFMEENNIDYSINVVGTFNVPVPTVTLVESATLKISDDYEAVIIPGKVKVGCQIIPIETVRKIIELHDKL